MSKIIKINESSNRAVGIFIERKFEIAPIRKVTVFFEGVNFLMTPYNTDNGVTFVAEGDGQIHAHSLNCGYGGSGPSATFAVLKNLGISEEKASIAFQSRGFSIDLADNFITRDLDFFRYSDDTHEKRMPVFDFNEFL
ncbi:hypothetical protein FACS1894217_13740 [Clostridia bacterium]|nr:hypothetical protein FACS1894217_13740 [Clostridia bacterium]